MFASQGANDADKQGEGQSEREAETNGDCESEGERQVLRAYSWPLLICLHKRIGTSLQLGPTRVAPAKAVSSLHPISLALAPTGLLAAEVPAVG